MLITIVTATPWLMSALRAVQSLGLESWCIGAGAVRSLVWDYLHGYSSPTTLADVDVAYFDASDLRLAKEQAYHDTLSSLMPGMAWEVCNQAAVHLWFEKLFGHPVEPLPSLEAAVASWPEFATSVAVTFDASSQLKVIAPHGLQDLFAMVVRRNPARVSQQTYLQRVDRKKYELRWPRVRVLR